MGPVIPIVAAAAVSAGAAAASVGVATALGATIAITAAQAAVMAGVSTLIAGGLSLALAPSTPKPTIQGSAFDVNLAGTDAPLWICYGAVRVAPTMVFLHVTGDRNQFYWCVYAIGEGEIEAVDDILMADVSYTDATMADNYFGIHLGADDQVTDAWFQNPIVDNPPAVGNPTAYWTTAHRGLGIAYLAIMAYHSPRASKDPWSPWPTINVELRGLKPYDPRTTSSAYSDNPALCILDYLTNARYGKGLSLTDLDLTSFEDAADYCDELVTLGDGVTTEKRFTCNAVLSPASRIMDNLDALLTSCQGALIWSAGTWKLLIDQERAAIGLEFSEANIVGPLSVTLGGKSGRFNRVRARYLDAQMDYAANTLVVDSTAYRTEDGGVLLEGEIELPCTTSRTMAGRIAAWYMKSSRQAIRCSFTATLAALEADIGDVVTVSHETPGWASKEFTVVGLELTGESLVKVTLAEYDDATYDLDELSPASEAADTYLPPPWVVWAPTNLALASGEEHVVMAGDGSLVSRILASWEEPLDYLVTKGGTIELQFKLSSAADWRPGGRVGGHETSAYLAPVEDAALYDVRIRSVNAMGTVSDWLTEYGHQVTGKTTPPPDVDTFLISTYPDGTRLFTWTLNDRPLDLLGYQLRYVTGTGGTWGAMSDLLTGTIAASPFETNQLAAGTYTFGIKAVDTSGNESTNATIIEATLPDPRLKNAALVVEPKPGWAGTLTDCHIEAVNFDLVADSAVDWDGLPATWADWTSWPYTTVASYSWQSDAYDMGVEVKIQPLTSVLLTNATAAVEYSTSSDGVSYTAFGAITGSVTCRYIKIKITATVTDTSQDSRITYAQFIASADTIEEVIEDLDTSGLSPEAGGGVRLPITKDYAVIRYVMLTLQSVGTGYTWELIDKDETNGPHVKIYDSAGTLDYPVIDAYIRGL